MGSPTKSVKSINMSFGGASLMGNIPLGTVDEETIVEGKYKKDRNQSSSKGKGAYKEKDTSAVNPYATSNKKHKYSGSFSGSGSVNDKEMLQSTSLSKVKPNEELNRELKHSVSPNKFKPNEESKRELNQPEIHSKVNSKEE
jgi:hypothetical protein